MCTGKLRYSATVCFPSLWQYIEDDDNSKYCVLVKFGSQTFMGAK